MAVFHLLLLLPFVSLKSNFDQEESSRDETKDDGDNGDAEAPAKVVVGATGHPVVLISQRSKNNDSHEAANSWGQE